MPLNILRGLFRGATRGVMTGKRGNKNFYKGIFFIILQSVNVKDKFYVKFIQSYCLSLLT